MVVLVFAFTSASARAGISTSRLAKTLLQTLYKGNEWQPTSQQSLKAKKHTITLKAILRTALYLVIVKPNENSLVLVLGGQGLKLPPLQHLLT